MAHNFVWKKLIQDIYAETAHPVVEIIGTGRVLIEHYKTIQTYQTDRICVCMGYGTLKIIGRDLHFVQISSQQLVIGGNIETICLTGGDQNLSVDR